MKHLRINIIISVFTLIIGVVAVTFWLIKSKPSSNVYSISFCDLMRESKHYDGKVIETKVSYQQGYEASFLIDSDCKGSITTTCPLDLDKEFCDKIFNSMDKYTKSSQVKFTVIGRYYDSKYDSFDGYVHLIEILEVKDTNISQTSQ